MSEYSGKYYSKSNDPYFEIKPPHPLEPGWHRIELELFGQGVHAPKMYLDIGEGFNEAIYVSISPSGPEGRFNSTFYLPRRAELLRFDPTDRAANFVVRSVDISRLSTPQAIIFLAKRAMALACTNPRRLPRALKLYARFLRHPHFLDMGRVNLETGHVGYSQWLKRNDYDPRRDKTTLERHLDQLSNRPLISILTPTYNTPVKLLEELFESIRSQEYSNWEWCIADDASTSAETKTALDRIAKADGRVRLVFREENGHISKASNTALELVTGEIVTLVDHDDLLHPLALFHIAKSAANNPDWRIIYSDEDKVDEKGNRSDPYFKGDFDLDLFYCHNLMTHLIVYHTKDVRDVGGFREGFEGSQDYDLALRILETVENKEREIIHIPHVLYHWRAIRGSIAFSGDQKSYAHERARKAINEHFGRIGSGARSLPNVNKTIHCVEYPLMPEPVFSIIICTRDRVDLLRAAITSVVDKTTDRNFEIVIVDNGSVEPKTHAYFAEVTKSHDFIKVVRDENDFNFSHLNNFGVEKSNGDYICLLNNDTEVISPNWLQYLRMHLGRKHVGAVGAKLLYSNDTIQHAGITMGLGGLAAHGYAHEPNDTLINLGKAQLTHQVMAVTGACLATRRDVWDELGGLDADVFKVAYNDVDYCLKVRKAGMIVIYEPRAELYHHESLSRGSDEAPEKVERFRREQRALKDRWGTWTESDPFFNPNLDYGRADFSLSQVPGVSILD